MSKAFWVLTGVFTILAVLEVPRCAQEPLRPTPWLDTTTSVGIVDMEVTGWNAQEQVVELTCPPRHIYTSVTIRLKVKLSNTIKGEPILYRYAKFVSYKDKIRVRLAFRTAPGKEFLGWSRDDGTSLVKIEIIQQFPAMK